MGTVFLGVSADERAVAVKVLRDGFGDPDARLRFRHELDALRRVRGPHLVELLDGDVEAETPYLVTRFVPGQRLDELVSQQGPLLAGELSQAARGIADALTTLHGAGVVHRDVSPGNVLMLDGQPHLIDLGLAMAAEVTALTRSGIVLGTPGYLAPEQLTGAPVTRAVDVHAWGATVALAGTGRPPYGTGRPEAVLYRIVHDEPDLAGLPAPLDRLVAAAMHRDPRRRPTAEALVAQLGGRSSAEPVTVRLRRDVDATDVLDLDRMHTQVLVGARSVARTPLPYRPEEDTRRPDDGWALDRAGAEQLAPVRRHPARTAQVVATGAAGLAVVGAAALVAPIVTAALALLLLVGLRAVARSADRLRLRRDRRGERRRDPMLAVLGAPWQLASATLDTLLSLPLLVAAAVVPAGAVWLLDPTGGGLQRPALTAATATSVALAVGLSRRAHLGSRRLLRQSLVAATPGPPAALAVLLGVVTVGIALLAVAASSAPVWWPLQQFFTS
jgi:hypothetical protein